MEMRSIVVQLKAILTTSGGSAKTFIKNLACNLKKKKNVRMPKKILNKKMEHSCRVGGSLLA